MVDAWHAMFLTQARPADLLYIYSRFVLHPDSVSCVIFYFLPVCARECLQLLTSERKVVQTEAEYAEQPSSRRAVWAEGAESIHLHHHLLA